MSESPADIRSLAKFYGLVDRAVATAVERGVLTFGSRAGYRAWKYGNETVGLWRRLDGRKWDHGGKVHTVTRDPGDAEACHRLIGLDWLRNNRNVRWALLCEGQKDALFAHNLAHHDGTLPRIAVLCAHTSGTYVREVDAAALRGKRVRIFVHADPAGRKFAARTAALLTRYRATVDLFNFDGLSQVNGEPVADLADARPEDVKFASDLQLSNVRATPFVLNTNGEQDTEGSQNTPKNGSKPQIRTQLHSFTATQEGEGTDPLTAGCMIQGLVPTARGQTNEMAFYVAKRLVGRFGKSPPPQIVQDVATLFFERAGNAIDRSEISTAADVADLLFYKLTKVREAGAVEGAMLRESSQPPLDIPGLAHRPALVRLLGVCVEMARNSKDAGKFFISSRDASRVGGVSGPGIGAARLGELVHLEFLEVVEQAAKGQRRATVYRLGPETVELLQALKSDNDATTTDAL
jgi:hypothetical protein